MVMERVSGVVAGQLQRGDVILETGNQYGGFCGFTVERDVPAPIPTMAGVYRRATAGVLRPFYVLTPGGSWYAVTSDNSTSRQVNADHIRSILPLIRLVEEPA